MKLSFTNQSLVWSQTHQFLASAWDAESGKEHSSQHDNKKSLISSKFTTFLEPIGVLRL